jgi:hypothetical protein
MVEVVVGSAAGVPVSAAGSCGELDCAPATVTDPQASAAPVQAMILAHRLGKRRLTNISALFGDGQGNATFG